MRQRLRGGLILALLVLVAASCGGAEPARRGDVVLIVLDTVRADHFSAYGYLRETTPNLDRLAGEGALFAEAWAQSPWTLPAVATILTGQPPHVHGAGRAPRGIYPISARVETLAERLSAAGYRSAAFVNVLWCEPRLSGLGRGFEAYDFHTSDATNQGHRDAAETTAAALDWLDDAGDAPVFLVVHYFDPHLTYDPPAPWDTFFEEGGGPRIPSGFGSADEVHRIRRGEIVLGGPRRKSLLARYDGEIRFADEQFAVLRRGLEQLGRWDDALVVVVGDHGEEFWDHGGFEHGHSHHRELLRVPLIVKRPGDPAGERFSGRVRQVDIAPTVLDFAGLPAGDDLPGAVLGSGASRFAVGEGSLWAGDLVSIRGDEGTLFLNRDSGEIRFFAPGDTLEQSPLPGEEHAPSELLDLLRALPAGPVSDIEPREITPEQRDHLRSLGYL